MKQAIYDEMYAQFQEGKITDKEWYRFCYEVLGRTNKSNIIDQRRRTMMKQEMYDEMYAQFQEGKITAQEWYRFCYEVLDEIIEENKNWSKFSSSSNCSKNR